MSETKNDGLSISTRSFIIAIAVILALMVLAYVLTMVIPGGEYSRVENENGDLIIDPNGEFTEVEGGIPFWKWLLSPVLVLGASGNAALIAVIAFLLVIGGAFNALDKCGLMKYMLAKIANRFGGVRYRLMAAITLFFMALGALVGSFEECVPLVPIIVALSLKLGWDTFTGLGMSMLAVASGFASGVCNPFTVGVAQQLAGLPMFSGIWLRLVAFALIYALLFGFLYLHAKKIEKAEAKELETRDFAPNKAMDRALVAFASILGVGILLVLSSAFIPFLQDITMIIVTVMFLVAGIAATLLAGMKGKALGSAFLGGVLSILPAVLMILMASSIKYTLEEAKVLDTVLHGATELAGGMPKWGILIFIYLIVLVMNFFIPSGSAKAFMLIPIIVPMAAMFEIPAQLCVLVFAFGDGFSNVFYPTNPALLISLGLAGTGYIDWAKWSWKFQALNLLLTSLIALFGLAIGYC